MVLKVIYFLLPSNFVHVSNFFEAVKTELFATLWRSFCNLEQTLATFEQTFITFANISKPLLLCEIWV